MAVWITPKGTTDVLIEGVTFRIRHLTAREKARVTDLIIGLDAARILEIIRIGVAGWSGNGSPACLLGKDGYLADASVDSIGEDVWQPLAQAILTQNEMTDDDRKNSQPSSRPASAT